MMMRVQPRFIKCQNLKCLILATAFLWINMSLLASLDIPLPNFFYQILTFSRDQREVALKIDARTDDGNAKFLIEKRKLLRASKNLTKIYVHGIEEGSLGAGYPFLGRKHTFVDDFTREIEYFCPEYSSDKINIVFNDIDTNPSAIENSDIYLIGYRFTFPRKKLGKSFINNSEKIFILWTQEAAHSTLNRIQHTWWTYISFFDFWNMFRNFWGINRKHLYGASRGILNEDYNYLVTQNSDIADFSRTYLNTLHPESDWTVVPEKLFDNENIAKQKEMIRHKFQNPETKIIQSFVSNCGFFRFADRYRYNSLKELKNILGDQMVFLGDCGTDNNNVGLKNQHPHTHNYISNNQTNYQILYEWPKHVKFYAAFENCRCPHYITEKLWTKSIANNLVPVVAGPPRSHYEKLLPKSAFIHLEDFSYDMEKLAAHLLFLSNNLDEYMKFFEWKEDRYFAEKIFIEQNFGRNNIGLCQILDQYYSGVLDGTKKGKVLDRLEVELQECEPM